MKSELLLKIHQPLNYNLQLNFGNQQIAIKPLRPSQSTRILGSFRPEYRTPLAHNFKGVSINNPSFANNNTVWAIFWIDKFNKSFAGKNIHKDAKNKKIYVQHYQVDQRVDIAYLSLCNGCALNNHQSGDCKFIVPNRDLVLIPIQSYVAHRTLHQKLYLLRLVNIGHRPTIRGFSLILQTIHHIYEVLYSQTTKQFDSHSGDPWNEFIDKKVAEVHNNSDSSIITFLTNNMDNINYVLKWNNITVEQSPRKFISQSSKVKGFEEFFNLARNTKYRRNCIDWKMTFDILSGSEVPNDTTFKSSGVKADSNFS
ncbi:hypothetical protein RhiirC2_770833 [Rhizophagus irregularis]|uniref:Uncharacterized protein n=2 Tax=Rhizophagus irregularis TaxID=588596 RepID=A0A2N1NVK1_9GLOM|nr:hypothetical protein RhiirC2_770833 [Rhizophagus irregularis]